MGDHYIPRYYLKGFVDENNPDQIWVYKRGNAVPFKPNIKNIAQERKFYTDEIETYLANEIENPANKVIQKIREMSSITDEEKRTLSNYMMVLWKRVPAHKSWLTELAPETISSICQSVLQQLDEYLERHPEKEALIQMRKDELARFRESQTDELIQSVWLSNLKPEGPQKPVDVLFSMNWNFWTCDSSYFVTSDNPLFFFRSMGIGNSQSEVSFPISKRIALWASWRTDLKIGQFIHANSQIVKEINRRTISNASRFVFSPFQEGWITTLINKKELHLNRIR